jgi:hypothetical protein
VEVSPQYDLRRILFSQPARPDQYSRYPSSKRRENECRAVNKLTDDG